MREGKIYELIEIAQKTGEKEDLAREVYEQFSPNRLWIVNKNFSLEDRKDIYQDSIEKMIKGIKTYSPKNTFATWFYKIVENTATDLYRKKKAAKNGGGKITSIEDFHYESGPTFENNLEQTIYENPHEGVENNEKYAMVRDRLNSIPEKYSRLIVAKYYEELSYEEIAKKFNLKIGTVKAQMFRAKYLLEERLPKGIDKQ